MPRVLYIMYGMPSCYNSGLTFARKFADQGIAISVACDQDIGDLVNRAGLPFQHLQTLSESETRRRFEVVNQKINQRHTGLFRYFKLARARLALRRESLADDSLLCQVKTLKPDLLLIDIECHLAIIATSTLKLPTALCSRLFDHRPHGSRPPLHSNLRPSQSPIGRLRIAMQWWRLRIASLLIANRQRFSASRLRPVHYRSSSLVDIKHIAEQYGVDLWSIATTAHWFRPVTYTHAPILSLTLRDLDFSAPSDCAFRSVGPMASDRDYAFAQRGLSEVDRFIACARQCRQTVVYCAMGTYAMREPRFVNGLMEMARLRADLALVISLGGRELPADYPPPPANALLLATAPQIKCLSLADAAILHAGIAGLQEALKNRVPVLIFSVGSNDQNGCAVRWAQLQLARRFSIEHTPAAAMAGELDALLSDRQIKTQIQRFGKLAEQRDAEFSPQKLLGELCA